MDATNSLRRSMSKQTLSTRSIDNIRKMLLSMVDDIRVVLIKLAEKLYVLKQLKTAPPDIQKAIATEAMAIYAPLANRLGIGQLKWQLEDLAFRYIDPDAYKAISKSLKQRRVDRDQYVKMVSDELQQLVTTTHIKNTQIDGRAKHIYSIYRKMQRKNVDIDEIYDAIAFRILVPSIEDCYTTLGSVHAKWKHIPKEFDDYVTLPKPNGYRSIHTAVIGPQQRHVEIQIRTHQMHDEAELGVAAHWAYKEGSTQQTGHEAKIAWLRQVMDWQKEITESGEEDPGVLSKVIDDHIYVFTPNGDVISLPCGATPLDFAYYIHSEVGNRCRGAKVNGKIVTLKHPLETGTVVDILTTKTGHPSRDWLNPHLGFIATARAKAKIQQWFNKQEEQQHLQEGHAILDKELKRHHLKAAGLDKIARQLNYKTPDALLIALGHGKLRLSAIVNLIDGAPTHLAEESPEKKPPTQPTPPQPTSKSISPVSIHGESNMLTNLARCCKPMPGDPIIGYITQGRGISVHHQKCPNIKRSRQQRQERLITLDWSETADVSYPIHLTLTAHDRHGLAKDITQTLANEKLTASALGILPSKDDQTVALSVTVHINHIATLEKIVSKLSQVPGVVDVRRT